MSNSSLASAIPPYDSRAFLFNGQRELLISGEIHYARIPEAEWESVLDATKAAGVNCIASYVFWNWHEPQKDHYDFSGPRDLGRFLKLCHERGLKVFLRAGPYCCAEWNYGGFPAWLRDEPGIEFRTDNAPYLARMEKYFGHLFTEVLPYLATRGGPIALVQLENEYANIASRYQEAGDRYLAWTLALGRRWGIDVPIVMCEGGAPGAIEALNGFSISKERIQHFKTRCPDQPLIWTELWTGWYDTWGYERHVRDPRNLAYHLLRFIASGGTAWNYYMWHAGTNFGRTAMFLQTTAYGFDAPLDEWGRLGHKGEYYAELHAILRANQNALLNGEARSTDQNITWKLRRESLRIEWDEAKRRATILDSTGRTIFDTESTWKKIQKRKLNSSPWRSLLRLGDWKWSPEPLPSERLDAPICREHPEDQLLHTLDETDYCWYSHDLTVKRAGRHELHLPFAADFLRVFVNGRPMAQSPLPLIECRGTTSPGESKTITESNPLEQTVANYALTFSIELSAGRNQIQILSSALGLIKGDWMISGPMTGERKGIWEGAFLNGKPLKKWQHHVGLVGGPSAPMAKLSRAKKHLGWWHTEFPIPEKSRGANVDLRLDLAGLDKGLLYLNGQLLSRYWLIEGHGYGIDESWHGAEENGLSLEGKGTPTQRFYRIPPSWLRNQNTLTLFEESPLKRTPDLTLEIRKNS